MNALLLYQIIFSKLASMIACMYVDICVYMYLDLMPAVNRQPGYRRVDS